MTSERYYINQIMAACFLDPINFFTINMEFWRSEVFIRNVLFI